MRYGESETEVVRAYVKTAKNPKGQLKLDNEMNFYRQVKGLRVPRVLCWNPFVLEAIDGRPATADDYDAIMSALRAFHVPREGDTSIVRYELYHKLVDRYDSVPSMDIRSVNGVKIPRFEDVLEFYRTVEVPPVQMCTIHGDPHFGNVLMDSEGPVFIDPTGRFDSCGVAEYDFAKVHLSLTGYN